MNEKVSGVNKNLEHIRLCVINLFFSMLWLNLANESFGSSIIDHYLWWVLFLSIVRSVFGGTALVHAANRLAPRAPYPNLVLRVFVPLDQRSGTSDPEKIDEKIRFEVCWQTRAWLTNTWLNRDAGILLPLISITCNFKTNLNLTCNGTRESRSFRQICAAKDERNEIAPASLLLLAGGELARRKGGFTDTRFDCLEFWWVIITTFYQVMIQSWCHNTSQSLVNMLFFFRDTIGYHGSSMTW